LAEGNGAITVLVPPEREQVGHSMPSPVALFRFADPLDRVLTA
jgi:hypothetical protein